METQEFDRAGDRCYEGGRSAVVETPSEARLVLSGVAGLTMVASLYDRAIALKTGGKRVTLDWSRATHVDGSVLQVLLALQAALAADRR